jgi:HlyD family secretion protein
MNSLPDRVVPRHRRLTAWLLLAAPLAAAAGCHRSPAAHPSATSADTGVVAVTVDYPKRAVIHREVSQPGAIEAFEETPVYAKVSGYIKEGWKDIGARLYKGEVLAELWVPELVDELKQKESLIEQAEAAIAQAREAEKAAEAAYKSAVAEIEVAEANRQILLKRQERTHKQYVRLARVGARVLDKEQVEEAQLGYETAKAGVVEAEAKIKAAQAMRDEAKARWSKAAADVRAAEVHRTVAERNRDFVKDQVGYMRLPAPYDCVVMQRGINTGDFVRAATAGEGKPLYVVHRTDLMRVFVQVPETEADWIQKGAEARLRVQVLPGRTYTGRVARISWSLDRTTRTLRAEIDLPNADGRLRPGMYVYATLSADIPAALTLPRSAVATEGDVTRGYQTYCYQVEDGKARRLLVELGYGGSDRVEVLRKQSQSGGPWEPFSGNEEIVLGDLKELRDGQPVQVSRGAP